MDFLFRDGESSRGWLTVGACGSLSILVFLVRHSLSKAGSRVRRGTPLTRWRSGVDAAAVGVADMMCFWILVALRSHITSAEQRPQVKLRLSNAANEMQGIYFAGSSQRRRGDGAGVKYDHNSN